MTAYDRMMVALCVWREARGESDAAMRGVAWVVRNRIADTRWPGSGHGVVLQPRQFSAFNVGDVNAVKFPNERDAADWRAWLRVLDAVDDVFGFGVERVAPGADADPTKGANHYHSIPDGRPLPGWARREAETLRLGPFRFYRL